MKAIVAGNAKLRYLRFSSKNRSPERLCCRPRGHEREVGQLLPPIDGDAAVSHENLHFQGPLFATYPALAGMHGFLGLEVDAQGAAH